MNDRLPPMRRCHQRLRHAPLADDAVVRQVREGLLGLASVRARIGPGRRVAITAGSRGIDRIDLVTRATVDAVKALGGEPFVFPAMGSHGGATPEGQREVLATLGITEATMGCPIVSSLEVVTLGSTPSGIAVYLDRHAAGADAIIAVNRIKAHTNFRGPLESGLCKMLAIGAGKHAQALAIHAHGSAAFATHIPEVAREVLARAPVVAGVGLLEDAGHRLAEIAVLPPDRLEAEERRLLAAHKAAMPRLPVEELDLLVVERIGKDVSGTGMDTNVIGRTRLLDLVAFPSPHITVIVALGLTAATKGNAIGMGACDLVTRRLADAVDPDKTAVNCLTGMSPQLAALPIVRPSDREAIGDALRYLLGAIPPSRLRVIRIRDTLHLETFEVSAAVAAELAGRDGITIAGEPAPWTFAADGTLPPLAL